MSLITLFQCEGERFVHSAVLVIDPSSRGGDVNVTDEDGDTPIYTAESVEVAKYLVDHGAIINRRNNEGFSVRGRHSLDLLCGSRD